MSTAHTTTPERLAEAQASVRVATPSPWLAVLSVALSAAVFCTTEFLPIGLLRYVSDSMQVSEGTAGLMVTVPGLLAALAAPVIAIVSGRIDRRRVLIALAAMLALSNLVALLAPSFAVLLAGRVVFGIALGGFWAVGAGIGARLVAERSVGRATALIFAGVSIGMLVGGGAGAMIGQLLGWRAAFGATLALAVLSLILQAIVLPSVPVDRRMKPRDLLGIVAKPPGRIGLLAMALALSGQFAAYTYVTPFLARQSSFGGNAISAILLGYTLIGLAGNFLGGAVVARYLKSTLAATMALFVLPVLLLPLMGHTQGWALALMAVWGLAYGAMPLALQTWMVRAAPDAAEGAMALFVANFQISIAMGSFVGGVVVDRLGVAQAMLVSGLLGLLALAVLLVFGRLTSK